MAGTPSIALGTTARKTASRAVAEKNHGLLRRARSSVLLRSGEQVRDRRPLLQLNSGFFDHVAPPAACLPDSIEPKLEAEHVPGRYDRLGIRAPFVAVSPYAKHHSVSHRVHDHASILKFIEAKFNIPALTARDANADNLFDIFDFENPDFGTKPQAELAKIPVPCHNLD